MIKRLASAALAGIAFVAATAAVARPVEPGQSTIVAYGDLDLASAAGKAVLNRRLRHAVDMVCGPTLDQDLRARMERRECRRYAEASASDGVREAMLQGGSKVRVASVAFGR